jgi:hypothetical protein
MPYAWQTESEREVTPQAPRIPKGQYPVRIQRIVFGNRHGPFQSQSGDPQIMLVFQDRQAREASLMVTLSEKAAFVLARLLGACDPPANLARMEQDGIEPAHFAREDFARKMLVDRQLTIEVDHELGRDGKEYPRVTPVHGRAPASPPAPADDGPPSTDDEPPPVADPPPGGGLLTKEQAWSEVQRAWANVTGDDARQRRNQAWQQAINKLGKPESELSMSEWAQVASNASLPF